MTIDEAIKHCEEVADTPCFTDEEARCYSEHRQLAEWLKELKAYRELIDKTEAFNKFIKRFQDIEKRPNYKIHNPYYWECYYEIEALLNECIEEVENNAD